MPGVQSDEDTLPKQTFSMLTHQFAISGVGIRSLPKHPGVRIVSERPDVLHSTWKFSSFNTASTKAANARALAVGRRPVG